MESLKESKPLKATLASLCIAICTLAIAFVVAIPAYATNVSEKFNDVSSDAWYTEHVQWAYDNGLMYGYTDDWFGVGDDLTRADFAVTLWRYSLPDVAANYVQENATNRTNMYDVVDYEYYTEAINWAYDVGIFTGHLNADGSRTFCPYDAITREEAITVIWRLVDGTRPNDWSLFDCYPDTDMVSTWSNWAMGWAVSNGVITGSKYWNGYWLQSDRAITREEVSKILRTGIYNEGRETVSIIALRAYRELQYGKWYEWGAAGPNTFDCSGLVGYCCTGVYGNHWTWTGDIINWNRVSDPVPGDICVVHNSSHQHCGIYIGDGQYINAPGTGYQIRINDVPSYMVYVRY